MQSNRFWLAALLLSATASLLSIETNSAAASLITQSYTFSFDFPADQGAPVNPWSGNFTITYDPSVFGVTGQLDAFNSNLDASYGVFGWTNQTDYGLVIGDACSVINCHGGPRNAFFGLGTDGSVEAYYSVNSSTGFDTQTGNVTAVPGPIAGAGLPGLIAGCGGLFRWWRRKRKIVAAT